MARLELVTECEHGDDRIHWVTPNKTYCDKASRTPLAPDRHLFVAGEDWDGLRQALETTVQDVLDALEADA